MKNTSYIPIARLETIAREEGCTLVEKTTCIMVVKGSNKTNRLYIARTRDVARVNINGFKIPDAELAATPPGGPVGTFLQVVRFDHSEGDVLRNFRTICRGLDTYKSEPKKPRGRPAGFRRNKNTPIPGPTVEVQVEESPRQHMDRLVAELAKKRDLATKLGFPLSPKTIASFEQKIADLQKEL